VLWLAGEARSSSGDLGRTELGYGLELASGPAPLIHRLASEVTGETIESDSGQIARQLIHELAVLDDEIEVPVVLQQRSGPRGKLRLAGMLIIPGTAPWAKSLA